MEINLKTLKALTMLRPYLTKKRETKILYGSSEVLKLFSTSIDKLKESNNIDYALTTISSEKQEPKILLGEFNIDGHTTIDDKQYKELFSNLCIKLREQKVMKK